MNFSTLFAVCGVSDEHPETMNSFSDEEFGCHFLDEGFTAKDILDQKINEVSSSVRVLSSCLQGHVDSAEQLSWDLSGI